MMFTVIKTWTFAMTTNIMLTTLEMSIGLTDRTSNFRNRMTDKHQWVKTYFHSPTWCTYCKEFLWGVAKKQGSRCSVCKANAHFKCCEHDICGHCKGPGFYDSEHHPKDISKVPKRPIDPTKNKNNSQPKLKELPPLELKVLIIGDVNVGKTSLMMKYCSPEKPLEEAIQTFDADEPLKKELIIDGRKLILSFWDTGGAEKHRTITQSFYHFTHGMIICYDLTNIDTWSNVERWIQDRNRYAGQSALMIVGNKLDLCKNKPPCISLEEVENYCENQSGDVSALNVSAIDGTNINELFLRLAKVMKEIDRDNEDDS